jgi:hypothetical protein
VAGLVADATEESPVEDFCIQWLEVVGCPGGSAGIDDGEGISEQRDGQPGVTRDHVLLREVLQNRIVHLAAIVTDGTWRLVRARGKLALGGPTGWTRSCASYRAGGLLRL